MKYKYRHQETYKDVKIDCVAQTKADLIAKVQRKREQIDKMVIDDRTRLKDFCKAYLDTYKKPTVSAGWYADMCSITDKMVDAIGNKPIGKITPMEVQGYLNTCTRYADSSIKKIYDVARQIFDHANLNGATQYTFSLTKPKGKQSTTGRSMTDEEEQAFRKAITGHRGELFFSMIYYCGLRPSEVSALLWQDIDLKRATVTVSKAIKKDGSIGSPKSLAGYREIPLPSTLLPLLKKSLKSKNSRLVEQRNGYHTKSSIRKMWDSVKSDMEKEMGHATDLRLYDIRHTYCTNLEKAGVPISIASRLMGHSDISITAKIYTHENDTSLELARSCIDSFPSDKRDS